MDGQGNLERTWKVREKSGNLKINGNGRLSSENLFILLKRVKDILSHDSLNPSPSSLGGGGDGQLLKEKIFSLGEQILSFNSNLQI